jgi:hypothetical protein
MFSILYIIGGLIAAWVAYISFVIVRRKIKSPEKTLFNCVLNELLAPVRHFKLGPYKFGDKQMTDIDLNIKYAKRKVKLDDLGDNEFVEQFKTIIHSKVQEKQRYTNLGYISGKIELSLNFVRRLRLIKYYKDVPRVLSVPVRAPVFVMGLPRTGTTFLHRLLSLDPSVRSPLLWELLNPVPKPLNYDTETTEFEADRKMRAKFIKGIIASRKKLGDHALDHIHEIEYDLPEECLMGLSDSLPVMLQYIYSNYMNIEEYLKLDATDAYKGYKKMLQLLSYQVGEEKDPKKWMLKCPIHLFYIKQIETVFPDAKLLWTHRHPVSAVPSLCSLIKAFHSVYYEPECCDINGLGRTLLSATGDILNNAANAISESNLKCGHVVYNELVKNPIETVKNIYAQMGWNFSDQYLRIMTDYLDANSKKRSEQTKSGGTLHHYTPETYGISESELCTGRYAEYISRFNVPMSKN